MNASNDDAETVDAFLERIASLKDRHNKEDEERRRKIEEEILEGRRERQARRAEQARSLSLPKNPDPTTSLSPLNSPYYDSSFQHTVEPPVKLLPFTRPHSMEQSDAVKDVARDDTQIPLAASPTTTATTSNTTAAALGRSGTLSWQQRPSSRDSDPTRSRPLSQHTDEVALAATGSVDEGRTRDQIALTLSSKDPSWFRQTADRGLSSSAYRKSREENHVGLGQKSRQLPGLSRESSIEPEKGPFSAPFDRPRSPSQVSSIADTNSLGHRFSSISSQATLGGPKSALPTSNPQKFGPSVEDSEIEAPGAKRPGNSSLQSQMSRDRSTSPTKGLGGFVQSAMMKRSDSVNKRWSAQAAPRLSRGNSVTSHRGGVGKLGSIVPGPASPPRDTQVFSQGGASSPSAKSRPTSSHSTSTVLHHPQPSTRSSFTFTSSTEIVPAPLDSSLAQNTPSSEAGLTEQQSRTQSPSFQSTDALPTSPTQTMNPKRWSPTKASWLESALSRPDSPNLTSPKPQTPSWMADLRKAKLSREDSDSIKSPSSNFTVVSPTGLMRSPPLGGHTRPLSISGLPEGFSSGLTRRTSPGKPRHAIAEENTATQSEVPKQVEPSSTSTQGLSIGHPQSPGTMAVSNAAEKAGSEPASISDGKKASPSQNRKPQTPPKIDFRANLKPRQKFLEESSSAEPEFKNVFGKLKRTETKNYVAPDELKDNILRGKAALNMTGGPQKVKRVDEFKESILKKKESMKAGTGFQQRNITGADGTDDPRQTLKPLPEALAKRTTLSQSTASSRTSSVNKLPNLLPEAQSSESAKVEEESVLSPNGHSPAGTETARLPGKTDKTHSNPETTKPQEGRHRPIAEKALSSNHVSNRPSTNPTPAHGPVSSAKPQTSLPRVTEQAERNMNNKPTGKLTARINPGLAGILSRGPTPPITSRNIPREDITSARDLEPPSTAEKSEESLTGQLSHMTKFRAKGPKRRLPQTVSSNVEPPELSSRSRQTDVPGPTSQCTPSENLSKHLVSQNATREEENAKKDSAATAPTMLVSSKSEESHASTPEKKLISPTTDDQSGRKTEVGQLGDTGRKDKVKPVVAEKSLSLKKVSSPPPNNSVSLPTELSAESLASHEQGSKHAKVNRQTEQDKVGNATGSFPRSMDMWQPKSACSTSSSPRPNDGESVPADVQTPLIQSESKGISASMRKQTLTGLGLKLDSQHVQHPPSQLTPPPDGKSAGALSFSKNTALTQAVDSSKIDIPPALQPNSRTTELLHDFFEEKIKIHDKAEVDAQAVILNRPSANGKSKVLRTQVWRITADGKKEDGLPHQEHILFEDSMHLCVHSFEKSPGVTATEVYLWSGDGVSEAAIEDAQLFCRREARENNAKLESFRQGKEPAKFFQALGGIVITRRSRNSALYMLCGRRHMGHIAFDEVDLDVASLCSGFPYIISARFGKLYLWKGNGSGADEVGCARLIGMDLGLTGEIEEVEEGAEPSSFFESFAGTAKSRMPSQHWSLKSRYDHHGCRLFRIELEQSKGMPGFWTLRGSSSAKPSKAIVQEIHPFCQRDLDPDCVFVLDAYCTVFVYTGVEAGAKTREFVTALMFAQEYVILAASLEDRPFVPTCNITFHGAPPDFAAAFRKWEGSTGLLSQHQKPCQVLALNEVLEALSSGTTHASASA